MFPKNLRAPTIHLLLKRQTHSNANILENCVEVRNRNKRSLERLRIARKPFGFHLDKPGFSYWNKIEITKSNRYITASVVHFEDGPTITVSTQEWALKKQLYSTTDASAYINVGRVLARRCLEAGIVEMACFFPRDDSNNITLLLNELEKNGIALKEHERYIHPGDHSWIRPEKPWLTYE